MGGGIQANFKKVCFLGKNKLGNEISKGNKKGELDKRG